ncbi:SMI1/KNR4 family protein [Prescottella defluvii]|uniref:SMI1/KNR4 family protein n=1 Tax=Prescottella defluvii TaxID=1323361 RepID=UPI0004F2BD61|nr:SMI1/KNR4 family protein [Prescottella defluvii]
MSLGAELVARIEVAVAAYGSGRPVPSAELREGLTVLGLVPDPDYEEFVGRWGGCFVGVPVHAWDNASILGNESSVELTTRAREAYGMLIDGVVIADDGSGNPIWIAADGRVRLVDHDNGGETVELAPDFRTLLADNVHD